MIDYELGECNQASNFNKSDCSVKAPLSFEQNGFQNGKESTDDASKQDD
jgi:hypothetical protein